MNSGGLTRCLGCTRGGGGGGGGADAVPGLHSGGGGGGGLTRCLGCTRAGLMRCLGCTRWGGADAVPGLQVTCRRRADTTSSATRGGRVRAPSSTRVAATASAAGTGRATSSA